MKLPLHTVVDIAGILGGIKINRIADKDAKAALLKDYIVLGKEAKAANADKNELIRKFQEDWADELPAVEKFRREGKPVIGHLDYLEAERDANKTISEIFAREVDVEVEAIPEDALFNTDCWDINIRAAEMVDAIDYMKEIGIIAK